MAKKIDLSNTKEANTVNTRSAKKVEREKALEALERAKKQKRKVVFVQQGDGEFRRNLNKRTELGEMLCSGKAAEYLELSYYSFCRRCEKLKVPFLKKGITKLFSISDLENYKEQIING